MTTAGLDDTHIRAHLLELLENFTPEQLRLAASHLEDREPDRIRRRRWRELLDDASFEELAEMLVTGQMPTIGWWRRHLAS